MFKKLFSKWTNHNQNVKNYKSETAINNIEFLSPYEIERCLLQETTNYERNIPVVVATNKENELFLIYYYPNTFYIVKVAYTNNKLSVIHDYRRKSFVLEGFQYRKTDMGVMAALQLMKEQVEFVVQPKMDFSCFGCNVIFEQIPLYNQFVSYLNTYRKNINESAMMRKNENGYMDLVHSVEKMSEEEKKSILTLLDEGNSIEAMRQLQASTGLGLADCKKVTDNPYLYL